MSSVLYDHAPHGYTAAAETRNGLHESAVVHLSSDRVVYTHKSCAHWALKEGHAATSQRSSMCHCVKLLVLHLQKWRCLATFDNERSREQSAASNAKAANLVKELLNL